MKLLISSGIILLMAGLAQAADGVVATPVQVQCELAAEVRRDPSGSHEAGTSHFVPATRLSQGEVVYYTVRIRNPSPAYASNVVVVQQIPTNTTYVAGSATAPAAVVEFSIDGGHSFAVPAKLQLPQGGRPRSAPPERYTHIRWQLHHPLAPGAVALARFQAVFD